MGPAEVWRMVVAGGGVAEMTVRDLGDAGWPRGWRVVDAFERERRPVLVGMEA